VELFFLCCDIRFSVVVYPLRRRVTPFSLLLAQMVQVYVLMIDVEQIITIHNRISQHRKQEGIAEDTQHSCPEVSYFCDVYFSIGSHMWSFTHVS